MKQFNILLLLFGLFIYACSKDDPDDMDDDIIVINDMDTMMMNDTIINDTDTIITVIDSFATVVLTITDIETLEGKMNIGFYDNEESWDLDIASRITEHEYAFALPEVTENTLSIVFDSLTPGFYAFSIYQDLNEDGEMEVLSDALPLPQEPYGFSNNFVPTLSAPNFSDCYFPVNYFDSILVEINLVIP